MISGGNLVNGVWESSKSSPHFFTKNPQNQKPLPTAFEEANEDQIQRALEGASESFESYRTTSFETRANFLSAIQKELQAHKEEILIYYQKESALPQGRAEGEFQRTLDQLQRFVELLQKGIFANIRIHTQGPDIRKMLFGIGPIVVFGASNFPLAFSTAGGDTASALAAGCPVIVKGHPYHAATSESVARCISNAVQKCNLPSGIFSHLTGASHEVGSRLVSHPLTKGVGFTGSFKGGRALFDLAQKRTEPIPVFSEMGSINPIFILENQLQTDAAVLAKEIAQSVLLGSGQFCTNPGLIVIHDPSGKSHFYKSLCNEVKGAELAPMVHSNIEKQYQEKLKELSDTNALNSFYQAENCTAAISEVAASTFIKFSNLADEVFGPFTLVVSCKTAEELIKVANALPGQLTATILGTSSDLVSSKKLSTRLQLKTGRLLFKGVPTGVAVTQAMQHGGPYPASTDPRFTAVGTDAIYRWLQPVAFQDCPQDLLPEALRNENPLGLLRSINGELTTEAL